MAVGKGRFDLNVASADACVCGHQAQFHDASTQACRYCAHPGHKSNDMNGAACAQIRSF